MSKDNTLDFDSLDTTAACEKPFELELLHPDTKKPLGVFVSIIGTESAEIKAEFRKELNRERQREFQAQRSPNKAVEPKTIEEQKAEEEWAKTKRLGEQGGSRLDDAWIHGKIVAKLVAASKVSPRTVSVDVTNNVVTLRGTVPEVEQKTEAERIAKETSGVKRVDNEIQVNS